MFPPAPPAVAFEDTTAPEVMLTEVGAVTASWPPRPAPEVPLSIREPPAIVRVLRLSPMSPVAPAPVVFTEIFAPSLIVSDGVVTVIWPAFPLPALGLEERRAGPARR